MNNYEKLGFDKWFQDRIEKSKLIPAELFMTVF